MDQPNKSVFPNFLMMAPKTTSNCNMKKEFNFTDLLSYFKILITSKRPHFQPEIVANN